MSRGDGGGSYSPGEKNYGTAREEEGAGGSARGRQGRRKQSGVQNWRNVRAVMAYYCSLRKIKRLTTPDSSVPMIKHARPLYQTMYPICMKKLSIVSHFILNTLFVPSSLYSNPENL